MYCPITTDHAVWLSICYSKCLSFDTHSVCCELARSACLVIESASLPYLNQSIARSFFTRSLAVALSHDMFVGLTLTLFVAPPLIRYCQSRRLDLQRLSATHSVCPSTILSLTISQTKTSCQLALVA